MSDLSHLESKIQSAFDAVMEEIVAETSNLDTLRFRLMYDGLEADVTDIVADIRSRCIAQKIETYEVLVRQYRHLCNSLGKEPVQFFARRT